MHSPAVLLLQLVNLCLCFAWGWGSMCRLHAMGRDAAPRMTAFYVAMFAGSVVCGLQFFLFGTLAKAVDLALSLTACAYLALTLPMWKRGLCV